MVDRVVQICNKGTLLFSKRKAFRLQTYVPQHLLSHAAPALLQFRTENHIFVSIPVNIYAKNQLKNHTEMKNLFSVDGKVVVITGAAGILGTSMVKHFAEQGAKVVILDRAREQGEHLAAEVKAAGGEALFLACDVLDKATLEGNYNDIMAAYGRIDVLINGAGGNMAAATVPPDKTIFDLDIEAVRKEAAEYKAKAEQAEKDAAAQLDAYKFDTWFDGLVAQNHGRDGAVIRTLAGTERMDALRKSQNRDADGKALFNDLLKNSAYAFEDQTPPPPPYAGGTGSASAAADDAAMRAAMGLPAEKK